MKEQTISKERKAYLKKKKRNHFYVRMSQLAILAFFLLSWEISANLGIIDRFIMSQPSRIVQTFLNMLTNDLLYHIQITCTETIIGFLLGTILGTLIACILWWSPFLSSVFSPYLVILNSLPKVALGPIIIVWVGAGTPAIITMALAISLIVTILEMLSGFNRTDPNTIKMAKTFGASRLQVFTKIVFPSNIPTLLNAFQVNIGLCMVGVITGEFLVSKAGLGYLIVYGGQVFKLDLVMTGVIILAIVASLLYQAVILLGKLIKERSILMKKWTIFLLVLTLCLTVPVLAPADTSSQKLTKLTVSEVTHSVFYAPQYVAIHLGFFEEHGIEVELLNSQGADKVMTAVLSGQVEIGFAGPEAAIYVYLQGKEDYPQVFAQLTKRDGSFLVGREKDESFAWTDLKGKHVLPGRKGGVPYMTLEYVIKQHGLDPQTDMNFDNSISFDAMTGAFVGGVGDYVTIFEPTATTLEREGKGYILASVGEASGEIPYTAYFANKSFLEKNPELIQNFVDAIYEGQVWVATHTPEEIAKVLLPSFPDSNLEVLSQVVERYQSIDAWNQTPVMTEEAFYRLQDVIEASGELEERVPFEKLVNNQFAKKAK